MKMHGAKGSDEGASAGGGRRLLARVVGREPLGGMMRLTLEIPGWPGAKPGQFALAQAVSSSCFLGRALSISDERGEEIDFLVAPIGNGTRELCALVEDSTIWVLGPLGNGFDLEGLCGGSGRVVLVGGGTGIAPFPLLLSRLPAPRELVVLLGFRDAEQALSSGPLQRTIARIGAEGSICTLEVITEDGSAKAVGRVTDLLERHLRPGDRLAVCGPDAMAREIWRLCLKTGKVEAWFSLEANMACGVGSCHGCVVAVADGSYVRVCREGPVFAGKEVFGG
jgi:dihydroorotate dehydrogenase electron transfer subunit